ncbi:extracellular solute-binding protein [Gordonia hydrophobica]|uniref:Extracellular solute-binding protein n=1 Tax=Gordonia hydrophobica TaxID=40516 RepID=A0ABZ2U2F3_9ACTN|nr:extracellular solute-binding protein [Gordonia hydrophobica]MBM7369081.1 iron(III) transport system substrate-binding protein [Gordonia hydrophobica]
MSPQWKRKRSVRLLACATAAIATIGLAAGCSSSDDPDDTTLTLYSGQHEDFAKALASGYEEATGVKVEVRAGKDAEMTGQIIEEGDRSKADVIITEEPGPMGSLDSKGLLAPVAKDVLAAPDQRFVPSTGNWLPIAARSRVMFFNPEKITEDKLPQSVLDLTKPEWKGRFAYAPSGAFKSTTAYLINTIGKDRTLEWLKGIKENGVNEQKNGKVRDSVEAGQHEFGLSNHYYWYILAKDKGGQDKLTSRVHYVNSDDAGALMLASGAGVLKSSSKQEQAAEFVKWLSSADGGQKVVASATPQFPLVAGVTSEYGLPALDSLTFPQFDQASLQNVDEANEVLKQAGIV